MLEISLSLSPLLSSIVATIRLCMLEIPLLFLQESNSLSLSTLVLETHRHSLSALDIQRKHFFMKLIRRPALIFGPIPQEVRIIAGDKGGSAAPSGASRSWTKLILEVGGGGKPTSCCLQVHNLQGLARNVGQLCLHLGGRRGGPVNNEAWFAYS